MKLDTNEYIFIPGQVPSSKRGKKIVRNIHTGRPMLISSDVTSCYKRERKQDYIDNQKRFLEMLQGTKYPVTIEFTFARLTHAKFDYGNLSQIVLDCMTGQALYPMTKNKDRNALMKKMRAEMAWIPDDCMKFVKPVYGDYFVDKDNPGVYIRVIK